MEVVKMDNAHEKLPQAMLPRGFGGWITGWIMPIFHNSVYKLISPVLKLKSDDDLLEVGCGSGDFLKRYAYNVRSIAGLDLSEVMIKIASRKNRKRIAAGTAEFVKGEASTLPWDNNSFSVVTSMGSFIAFPKPLESLKEMHRVLRPGGRVIIGIEFNKEDGVDRTKMAQDWGIQILS
jgi:ubiquinone/menaquinone biosynthesis C-methylase UbiE